MMATAGMPDGLPLTDVEFSQFQRLIHAEAGIYLSDAKRALLVSRIARRVRDLGLPSFGAYYRQIAAGDDAELVKLLDAIATNETEFFRERRQFDLLEERICSQWQADAAAGRRPRHVRVWSAACSTGEEPYSIAMSLHHRLAPSGWDIEVLASDLSTRALERARAGVWPVAKTRPIPAPMLRVYMLRGVGPEAGNAAVTAGIRGLVRFHRINLRDDPYPVPGGLDAVFCRNVLMYFDVATREEVTRRLLRHLAPGGYLFLGHAESLTGRAHALEPVMPAVYRVPVRDVSPRAA